MAKTQAAQGSPETQTGEKAKRKLDPAVGGILKFVCAMLAMAALLIWGLKSDKAQIVYSVRVFQLSCRMGFSDAMLDVLKPSFAGALREELGNEYDLMTEGTEEIMGRLVEQAENAPAALDAEALSSASVRIRSVAVDKENRTAALEVTLRCRGSDGADVQRDAVVDMEKYGATWYLSGLRFV